jgi:protein-disulfide isomerase
MTAELTSAGVPPVAAGDHVRGEGVEVILYMDLGCPHCALVWSRIRDLQLRLVFRHFPVSSKHPRAPALHAAAEAAANQRRFWEMCDSLLIDQGHHDDPHLWERARRFGLDLDRFERERRSDRISERVRRDFLGGIRAGVSATPAAFADGRLISREVEDELARLLS